MLDPDEPTDLLYDKEGNRISVRRFGELSNDNDYRRIASTTLEDGTWISTVWIGIDHRFGPGVPVIFETMVFESEDRLVTLDCQRYSTEADAFRGHHELVALLGIQKATEKSEAGQ